MPYNDFRSNVLAIGGQSILVRIYNRVCLLLASGLRLTNGVYVHAACRFSGTFAPSYSSSTTVSKVRTYLNLRTRLVLSWWRSTCRWAYYMYYTSSTISQLTCASEHQVPTTLQDEG